VGKFTTFSECPKAIRVLASGGGLQLSDAGTVTSCVQYVTEG